MDYAALAAFVGIFAWYPSEGAADIDRAFVVPELTRRADIKLNERVSLRLCDHPLSLIVVH
jgi:hypothetical protein